MIWLFFPEGSRGYVPTVGPFATEYVLCYVTEQGKRMTYGKDKLERFAFRLDEETARFLKEDSASLGMSSSAYLRMLVLQRRANVAISREVQEKASAQAQAAAQAALDKFAGEALALLKSEVREDADKALLTAVKTIVADKADKPKHENT